MNILEQAHYLDAVELRNLISELENLADCVEDQDSAEEKLLELESDVLAIEDELEDCELQHETLILEKLAIAEEKLERQRRIWKIYNVRNYTRRSRVSC